MKQFCGLRLEYDLLNFGILASEGSWYFQDLKRAAAALGHGCTRLSFERLVASVSPLSPTIRQATCDESSGENICELAGQFKDRSLAEVTTNQGQHPHTVFDAIIVRTMPPGSLEQVVFRMDVLARIEASGVKVVNSPKALECAVDKYLTTARLQAVGLPVPDTIVCEHEDDALKAFQQLGGDVVVKPLFGSEGRGIVRVSDADLAHRTFRTLMRLNSVLYLQRFVDHGGCDVRIVVLDGQVLGGMRRRSPNDFRTNVAREATPEWHSPTQLEIDLALAAAATTGTFIAGVDLLYDRQDNCYVIEVNAVPGWQAFGRVNSVDVAANLIERLANQV